MHTDRTRDVTLGTRRRAPVAVHVRTRGAAGRPRVPAGAPAAPAAAAQPAGGRAAAHVAAAAAAARARPARGGRAAGAPPCARPRVHAPARAGQPERAGGVLGGAARAGSAGAGQGAAQEVFGPVRADSLGGDPPAGVAGLGHGAQGAAPDSACSLFPVDLRLISPSPQVRLPLAPQNMRGAAGRLWVIEVFSLCPLLRPEQALCSVHVCRCTEPFWLRP
jgi:hypothetical protein